MYPPSTLQLSAESASPRDILPYSKVSLQTPGPLYKGALVVELMASSQRLHRRVSLGNQSQPQSQISLAASWETDEAKVV
jgi:hypothetical protein